MNNPNEQNSTSLTGIGSMCYFIPKDDLHPDTLTPKEGKQWHEINLASSDKATVASGSAVGFRQSFTMTGEIRGNWLYRPPRPPHFRRRRLHIKYGKKLARYIMTGDDVSSYIMRQVRQNVIVDIISSRKDSHNLNRAIKQLKKNNYNKH